MSSLLTVATHPHNRQHTLSVLQQAGRTYKSNKQRSSSESGEISTFSMQCQFLLLWSFSFTPWSRSSINMIQHHCSFTTSQMRASGRERKPRKKIVCRMRRRSCRKRNCHRPQRSVTATMSGRPQRPRFARDLQSNLFSSFFFKVTFSSFSFKVTFSSSFFLK